MSDNVLIFDIDGVLNRHGNVMEGSFAEPDCVKQFNRIVDATDCRLVCCSAWRHLVHGGSMTVQGFAALLRSHGIRGSLIDVTRESKDPEDGYEPRYKQIADWLKRPLATFKRYAILDDNAEAFGGRPGVRPDGSKGLTAEDADKVIAILNG
jgi:hypothetical protein